MQVFAAVDYQDSVLRMFSTLADAEAFVEQIKALDVIHEAWVFSPASGRSDFVAPEGFEGLEDFVGLDIWGVVEYQVF
jgi:hypothetical protein